MTNAFELHPQLAADCETIADTALCRVLLSKDRRYPWVVLVPRQPDLKELHDLNAQDRATLIEELAHISQAMQAEWQADKTNVAALGNMVPQLHIHVVMRFETDAAWPGPIWGIGTAEPYDDAELTRTLARIKTCLPARTG